MNLSICEVCGTTFRPPFQKEKERFCSLNCEKEWIANDISKVLNVIDEALL